MRIAIDASTISTQGGPRTYVLGLLDALFVLDQQNDYVVFYNDASHLGRFPQAQEVVLSGKSPLSRLWREHVLLPKACRKLRVDVLHCPKSAIPLLSPHCPVVVTLHDLIPLQHPELETRLAHWYWRLHIPMAVRSSNFIITISEFARREILDAFEVPEERIMVILNGFDRRMLLKREASTGSIVRDKYGLPESYLLYVGTIQPRKNIGTMIEAYVQLRREKGVNQKLVIVGRKGWLYESLFTRIKDLELENEVIFTGFVPDDDLAYLYDGASVFVYLSLFEGFGIPPLEAMACAIPVVCSNTTSLPEVIGDAGISVAPTDVPSVVDAIASILNEPDLAAKLRSKGRLRAELFSWEKAAEEVLSVYRQIGRRG